MSETLDKAVDQEFHQFVTPYRRELFAHCYRMLGSVHDAEDLVQETYLKAWRAYDRFEHRSSVRTWLHRIATTACLNALESRRSRPMPMGLAPNADPRDEVDGGTDVPWLEPILTSLVVDQDDDPVSVVTSRESVRLALVAILQLLPPRQRAVLVLSDVLQWRAAEVADVLETTSTAVYSMLQRARALLNKEMPQRDDIVEPSSAAKRKWLDEYAAAWEQKNVPAIVRLFTEDVVWEMPPLTAWYQGREDIAHHLAHRCPVSPGQALLIPADANGQPAFATYTLGSDGMYHAAFLQVLTLTETGISHVYAFLDLEQFTAFGLPLTTSATPHS